MNHPCVETYARHVNPAFVKLLGVFGYGRVFVRAKDVWLWDHEDRRYLDALAGFGSFNLGHNHPALLGRLREFLDEDVMNLVHVGPSPHMARLAEELASLVPLEIVLFASSGAEAVEAAMKLARAATRRKGFVSCRGGFHGTNLGTLSIMGEERMRKPFEPLLAECVQVPFGDSEALGQALHGRRVAGFVVEPIQGEGGVIVPPPGYLREARDLCRKYGTLLIADEVQTGLGRTGTIFASDVMPDILVLGKALGSGMVPISATLASREIHRRAYGSMDRFDLHASTYGGNALGCVAALETLRILKEENLVAGSAARGTRLLEGLRRRLAGHPLVREIRGRGLLVGIELGPTDIGWANRVAPFLVKGVAKKVFGQWASMQLLERGILCQPASHRWDVLKIEPPLTIAEPEIDALVDAVADVLADYRGIAPILRDATRRIGQQFRRGWAFR